jgi:hypothetical protein
MNHEPQIAANQDKNYLKALSPLLFVAVIFCNTACYAAKNDDDLRKLRALANKYIKASNANQAEDKKPKAEDKKVDTDDQAQHDSSVREAIPLWEMKSSNNREWSEHIYRELPTLGPALLSVNPADAKIFCPNYRNLNQSERKQFWAFFISTMVKFESNFNPKASLTEGFRDNTGRYVVSRGLLQISLESSKSYGCGFKTAAEIHHPQRNLSCGIKILNHWMQKDGRIASKTGAGWRGGARYWAVLRQGPKDSYRSIVKWNNALPICKL